MLRSPFTLSLLLGASAGSLLFGGTAFAQTAPAAETAKDNEIVVTGFRGSLRQSIDVKRSAVSIVDAISAEDIADLPDLNLAESLQRVPGVQIDRDGGEGRSINVRGLSSDFVRVQLNGMEALATTGGRDGRANRNRQFDFNVFASELFNSITVSKSQEAAVSEGSLGATVGLQTARPFDFEGFQMAASAKSSYNDLSENTDPRGTFLVSNRWLGGRLGALFSAAYSTRNTFEEGSSSGRFRVPADDGCASPFINLTRCYQSVGSITNAAGNVLTGAAARTEAANGAHPRIPRYGRISYDRERLGMTGAVQFQPFDTMSFKFDTLYAKLKQTRKEEFLEAISFAREAGVQGLRTTDLVSGVVNSNRTLVSATFDDVDMRSEQRIDKLETEFLQNTLSADWDVTDRFRVSAMLGLSKSIGRNPQQTTISLERYDVDGYSYDYSNINLPRFNYGFDVANPANWQLSASTALGDASLIRLRPNKTVNSFDLGQIDLSYRLNDHFTLKGGASSKEFGFRVAEVRRANEGLPASVLTAFAAQGVQPSAYMTTISGVGSKLDLPAGTPTTWVIPDLNALDRLISFSCNCVNGFGDFRLARFDGETRGATERSNGAYAQLDWDVELAGMPFRGNAGVRYVETELTSNGILNGAPLLVSNTYKDTLPSLNVVVEPVENVLVRFAASKVMARPSLDTLTPGGSVDAQAPGLSLNTGNPFLNPIRSNNYDVSVEWYPYEDALFSIAFFRKEIGSFVQRLQRTVPYSETGFPSSLLGAGVTPADLFVVTSQVNTPGGTLDGFEITLQTPFTFLKGPLEGFGGLVNYTKIDSSFSYITNPATGASVTQPLVGQSPRSASATLYYERGPFEARVSATYRDEYLTLVPAASGNDVEGKADQLNVDFSASYDVSERITVSFEGVNLTDEFDERWISSQRKNSNNYEHTGREFVLGVQFKY